MRCPKCGHDQQGGEECGACGIIFEKYSRMQQRQQVLKTSATGSQTRATATQSNSKSTVLIISIIGAAILMVATAYFFIASNRSDSIGKPQEAQSVLDPAGETDSEGESELEEDTDSIARQLESSSPARNPLEKARNATVYIKSNIGIGSGFFIDSECHVLSNRHVIRLLEDEREKLAYEKEELAMLIEQMKDELQRMVDHYHRVGVTVDEDNLPQPVAIRAMALHNAQTRHDQIEQLLEGDAQYDANLEITLVDGSVLDAEVVNISEGYDLALLRAHGDRCPSLDAATEGDIRVGTKVFAIGNPSGLSHTVTSGILSGYREEGESRFIQTDAAINPGNSGGPLLNEAGSVLGINTKILRGTEGIGFAIPIDRALEEFADYL